MYSIITAVNNGGLSSWIWINLKYSSHTTSKVIGILIWLWWSFHAVSWMSWTAEIHTIFIGQLYLDKSSGISDRTGDNEKRMWVRKVACLAQTSWGSGHPSGNRCGLDTVVLGSNTDSQRGQRRLVETHSSCSQLIGPGEQETASWTFSAASWLWSCLLSPLPTWAVGRLC